MISCRDWVKPLIIIFKEVNQNQSKNYGGPTVFPFLLPILDRIRVSLISVESKLAPARPTSGKPYSFHTSLCTVVYDCHRCHKRLASAALAALPHAGG